MVLSGFSSSPYGLMVKTINVAHTAPTTAETPVTPTATPVAPQPYTPPPPPPPTPGLSPETERRYGINPYLSSRPVYTPPAQPAAAPAAAPKSGGLQVVLDESPLRVTIMLDVVKLVTHKETKAPGGPAPGGPATAAK